MSDDWSGKLSKSSEQVGCLNHTNAMFTSIEGEWDEVMAVVKAAVEAVAQKTNRVSMVLKADMRAGVTNGLVSKLNTLNVISLRTDRFI